MPVANGKRGTRVVSVASGKGGVGKTSVSVNLAFSLGAAGRKVCLLDADLGLSNVDILLGASPPHTLEEVIFGGLPMESAAMSVGSGVDLISGDSGVARMADLSREQRVRLSAEFDKLSAYDYLIVDNSPGVSPHVISLCLASEEVVVVITPEAASVTDAYALIKVLKENGLWRSPLVLFNRVRSMGQAKAIFSKFNETVRSYLGLGCRFLGAVPEDAGIARAAALRTPLVEADRSTAAAMALVEAARNLDMALFKRQPSMATPGEFVEQSVVRLKQGALGRTEEAPAEPKTQPEPIVPDRPPVSSLQRDLNVLRAMISTLAARPQAAGVVDDLGKLRRAVEVVSKRHAQGPAADEKTAPQEPMNAVVVCPDVNLLEVLVELARDSGFTVRDAVVDPFQALPIVASAGLVVLCGGGKGEYERGLWAVLDRCQHEHVVFVEGFVGRSEFAVENRARLSAVVQRPFRIGDLTAIFRSFAGPKTDF